MVAIGRSSQGRGRAGAGLRDAGTGQPRTVVAGFSAMRTVEATVTDLAESVERIDLRKPRSGGGRRTSRLYAGNGLSVLG